MVLSFLWEVLEDPGLSIISLRRKENVTAYNLF